MRPSGGFIRSVGLRIPADSIDQLIELHDHNLLMLALLHVHGSARQTALARFGDEIRISVSARSFLHNQVRSMTGSLAQVGEGRWSAGDLQKALEAKNRAACGPVAPACGLYLVRVDY